MVFEPGSGERLRRGIGCAAVIPATLIGLAGLADGIGPKGWPGLSEFIGWAALCLAASRMIARLLARVGGSGVGGYAALVAVPLAIGAFTYLPYWLGLYAPWSAKVLYTSSLQVVGSMATGGFVLWIVCVFWGGGRP
jgi:hypothetical protein